MSLPWRPVPVDDGPPILTSITHAETAVLRALAADAGDAVDVGSAYGYSAIVMAAAGARVTTIDPHAGENPGTLGRLMGNVQAYLAAGVVIKVGTSQEVLPVLHADGRQFGLVFIDGDHHEATVTHDVMWARKLLRPGGTLACHDYDEATCPGVRAALDRLMGGPGELTDTLAVYRGLS